MTTNPHDIDSEWNPPYCWRYAPGPSGWHYPVDCHRTPSQFYFHSSSPTNRLDKATGGSVTTGDVESFSELSEKARAKRKPLPPEELFDARHDRVHRNVGRSRAAHVVRAARLEEPDCLPEGQGLNDGEEE